jgi:hypothetical protein
VTLTQLGGVGNDGANAESPSDKAVEHGRRACVVVDLLNPTLDKAYAYTALESFDGQLFQVGQDPVLIMGGGILCVKFHLPDRCLVTSVRFVSEIECASRSENCRGFHPG